MSQSVGAALPLSPDTGAPLYSPPGRRAAAFLIDAVVVLLPTVPLSWLDRTEGDGPGYLWAASGVFVVLVMWNVVIRQGRTGYSVGKQAMGIRLLSERTLEPIGPLNSYVRGVMHIIVDYTPLFAGYIYGLFDHKRQTFADKIMRSISVVESRDQAAARTALVGQQGRWPTS